MPLRKLRSASMRSRENRRMETVLTCRIAGVLALTVLFLAEGPAQERRETRTKEMPEFRSSSATSGDSSSGADTGQTSARPLPSIDLPEFVVTGTLTIDLPMGDKAPAGIEPGAATPFEWPTRSRERMSIGGDSEMRKAPLTGGSAGGPAGRILASIGTFFSPSIEAWAGQTTSEISYGVQGSYHRTKGWVEHSDKSGGSLRLDLDVPLRSTVPLIDQALLSASVGYGLDEYRFYGSIRPATERQIDSRLLNLSLRNYTVEELPFEAAISVRSTSVNDSSARVQENGVELRLHSVFQMDSIPIDASFRFASASETGDASGTLSLFDLAARARISAGRDLLLVGGVRLWSLKGLENQQIVRALPVVHLEYTGIRNQRIYGAFAPEAGYSTLQTVIGDYPYCSARTAIRHSNDTQKWVLGVESAWLPSVTTTLEVQYRAVSDFPIPVDSSGFGIWSLRHEDAAIVSGNAKVVAKLTANDYFASGLVVRSARASVAGSSVPFIPRAEGDVWYQRQCGERVTLLGEFRYCSNRTTDPEEKESLPAYTLVNARVSYSWLRTLTTFVEFRNMTNRRVEWWKGYSDRPFTAAIGLLLNW